MALPLKRKKEIVAEIKEKLSAKDSLILLAEFKNQSVAETTVLRNKLFEGSVSYDIYKNTLVKHAIEEIAPDDENMKKLFPSLKGQTAFAYSAEKPFECAKLMTEAAKSTDKLNVKAGLFEGKFMSKAELEALAAIGSKEQLISRLLFAMKSPMSRLVNALGSPQTKLVYTLKAVADQMEK